MAEVIADEQESAQLELLPLPTPGDVLRLDFMEPLGVTPYRLAKAIGVDQGRIEGILDGKRAITPDTAMRLSRYFGTSAGLWLNLQTTCDLRRVERDMDSGVYDKIAMHPAAVLVLAGGLDGFSTRMSG